MMCAGHISRKYDDRMVDIPLPSSGNAHPQQCIQHDHISIFTSWYRDSLGFFSLSLLPPPSAPLLPSTHPLIPVGRCLRFSGDVRFFRILSVLRPSSIILPILIGSPIESGESESPCRDSRGSSADRFHIPLINSD